MQWSWNIIIFLHGPEYGQIQLLSGANDLVVEKSRKTDNVIHSFSQSVSLCICALLHALFDSIQLPSFYGDNKHCAGPGTVVHNTNKKPIDCLDQALCFVANERRNMITFLRETL